MTYEQTCEYINSLNKFGVVLGLDNMNALLAELGHPEDRLKIIHIAGTNGKGSVGAFIGAMLRAKGFKVGRYVSPTVFCYEERFQKNGEYISKAELAHFAGLVRTAAEKIGQPTVFEVETALALCWFADCDYVLLEVGMGGRLDATNAVKSTLCSVITTIGLDHTAILGDTLAKIAYEKAGIIKQNGRVFSAVQQDEAAKVLESVCAEQGAELTFCGEPVINADGSFDYKKYKGLKIGLSGIYQYKNAALAIEVFDGLFGDEEAMRKGLETAEWKGRFQVIKGEPTYIFDGAHNPQGVEALMSGLESYDNGNMVYICGIFADKDYKTMVKTAAKRCKKVYTVTPPSPRALSAEDLKSEFLKYLPDVKAVELNTAIEETMRMKDACVVVFGSLSFLGEAIETVGTEGI
ncbi:MAG: bifunctional folylpolyglutamate synthase/dihydrofolate synthase [Firmicutes bacterium]|nr:bifunctional folylpolyglutamate synthase/dihydrofolate synthase [Bacillota bacterium]